MTPETDKSLDARFAALRLATADALPPAETDHAVADAIAYARAARSAASRPRFRWPAWPVWAAFATAAAIALVMLRPLPPAVVDDPLRAADAVDAELLVRGDGSLLAVRLIP